MLYNYKYVAGGNDSPCSMLWFNKKTNSLWYWFGKFLCPECFEKERVTTNNFESKIDE